MNRLLAVFGAVFGSALMHSVCVGATVTIQSNSWLNMFPIGNNSGYFTAAPMTQTRWYWGSWPQCGLPITNDAGMDAQGDTSSGSMFLSIPFTGSGQQGWIYSTFDATGGWNDGTVQIPLNIITNLSCDVYVASGTPLSTYGNYGSLNLSLYMGSNNATFCATNHPVNFTDITIPASADGAWVHLVDTSTASDVAKAIALGYTNACAMVVYVNNFNDGGYPPAGETFTFFVDNLEVTTSAGVTVQNTSWTNTFPIGTNTTYFTNAPMTETRWYWGNWGQCSEPITNDPAMDVQESSSSGSMYLSIPYSGSGQQGWIYSTFDPAGGWNDGKLQMPLADITQLACDVYVKSGTALSSGGNFGAINLSLYMASNNGAFCATNHPVSFTDITIPASANGAWVHLVDTSTVSDVAKAMALGYTNACALAIYVDNFDWGYPPAGETFTYYLDNLAVTTGPGSTWSNSPPPPNTNPPVAQFKMSSNIVITPCTVTFQDTSLNSPTSWYWTFGDGGTSTSEEPSHTFTNMWRQIVTLVASNQYGQSTNSQAIYQCFPCDVVYDWTAGTQGQVAQVASLSNSIVPGGSTIGYFTTTNRDVPQNNLRGIIFTNLPGMTNGCPVVFSNGTIYSNFNTTNALAYCWSNDFEQYDLHLNSSLVVTDIVLLFYSSMPLCSNIWFYGCDELNIATTKEGPANGSGVDLGLYCMNRELGCSGPEFPYADEENDFHTSETCNPTTLGTFPTMTNTFFNGTNMYCYPNKLYRILMEENTNGECVMAIADPATSTLVGFVTNWNTYEQGHLLTGYADGHTSFEVFTNNGLGASNLQQMTSILAYHSVITINRPLSWFQASNLVMFGP